MTRTFIQTKQFSRDWDELGLTDSDLRIMELDIMQDPKKYPVIKGTGGLRKMRFPLTHKGKRSSARVCYVDFDSYGTIYLIAVYGKNVKENITMQERNDIKKLIENIRIALRGDYNG